MKRIVFATFVLSVVSCMTMFGDKPMRAPDELRVDQWAYLAAHNAFSSKELNSGNWGVYPFYAQQRTTLSDQMKNLGVRAILFDIWYFDPKEILKDFGDKTSGLFNKATSFVKNIF